MANHSQQNRLTFRRTLWLALLLILTAIVPCKADEPAADEKPAAQAAGHPHIALTISKETTYLTEPLRADGYIDYVADLNRRSSEGVTPENNAAVLFWQAVGPSTIVDKQRDEFFKRLGIAVPPETGDYFVPLAKYVEGLNAAAANKQEVAKTVEEIEDQSDAARNRSWTAKEFPTLAGWLAANEKPLALLTEAARRPRRYDPLIAADSDVLIAVLLPAIQQYREVTRALVARAMLRASEGKIDEAWEDLLTCHRLARLAGQGLTLIDTLVGVAIDSVACAGDQALLRNVRPTAAQIAKMRADLDALAPMPKAADKIDITERFAFLDSVAMTARSGVSAIGALTGEPETNSAVKTMANLAAKGLIDWDQSLRLGNIWYDRMAEAYRQPTRAERKEALDAIDHDLKKMVAEARDWQAFALPLLFSPRQAASQRMGQVLVSLLVPAIQKVAQAEDRGAMLFELDRLAFALAAYQADHGSFPDKLAELAPKYVAEVPRDFFAAADLHYARDGDGYLLYSVGVNGVDDGGKGYADVKEGENWDDLVIRMPLAGKQTDTQ